jgi:transposase
VALNGLRYILRIGMRWHMMPNDLPSWHTVYQQTLRWLQAGVFEDMVRDLRVLMREIEDRMPQPRAAILDSRTLQSSLDSGGRAGHDGHKRRKGSKVHMAVDTLGQLLAVTVTPANEQDRTQVAQLAEQIQEATGGSVEVAFVDQAARESGLLLTLRRMASDSKSLSCPLRNAALCCCLAGR